MRGGFSLLELILVLCIIAILATIALPYINSPKQDAILLKLKADLTMIQSGIAAAKNEQMLVNSALNLSVLDEAAVNLVGERLFYCSKAQISACNGGSNCCTTSILNSGIVSNTKGWLKTGVRSYRFYLSAKKFIDFEFNANESSFECLSLCKELL
ncbi:type II secretion system protein [Campylobacter troglodytis]|uniref:type II secretion system protein n=1 Tax=Campylobacter troglodytis TaxID=654363 RepID=UPI00115B5D35|nr:type II secretion system protein [Campylobacter troglodytis]TQR61336.1 type II secretion system protein [Campylobacter troglodytis]